MGPPYFLRHLEIDMSVELAPLTELDAVNDMLASIGKAPVNTLEGITLGEVARARTLLRRAVRTILSRGYQFNSDEAVNYVPDINGHILIGASVLQVDATDPRVNVVERTDETDGLKKLWNKTDNTFVFGDPIDLDVVRDMDFNDLPEHARSYAAAWATLLFQSRKVPDQIITRVSETDVARAEATFNRIESKKKDRNMLRSYGRNRRIFSRPGRRYR